MRYTGNICDGCKATFTDADDVVVCPECATPQHRSCYEAAGQCVNAHLHSEGFQWAGTVHTEKTEESPKEKALICPNCSAENPAGSEQCTNCGMKFIVFGKNIAEMFEEAEKEGYHESGAHHHSDADSTDDLFRGPYPSDDMTFGQKTNTLGVFMRGNADYYIRKFKNKERGGKLGFNFAAFLFSPYWFFYRKLYKPGIIFLTVSICANLLMTPKALTVMTFLQDITPYLEANDLAAIEAATTAAMGDIFSLAAIEALLLLSNIIAGIIANRYYLGYTLSATKQILSSRKSREEKVALFAKIGGVSWLAVMLCYFASQILMSIANLFM